MEHDATAFQLLIKKEKQGPTFDYALNLFMYLLCVTFYFTLTQSSTVGIRIEASKWKAKV